ncbi:MAG: hypothetical protein ABIQ53_08865, partial [Terracoccus sp.]
QAAETDLEMIRDNGFVVLGSDDDTSGLELVGVGMQVGADAGLASHDPAKRRRGAGTDASPNA